MTELKYKFTNDTLFKLLFVKNPDLLKRLVAELLSISLEDPIMTQAIEAYRNVTATDEFKELERLRSRARHNEASALGNAERRGYRKGIEEQQAIIAEKDAALADKDIALAGKDAAYTAALADKDAQIAELLARLGEKQ